MFLNPDKQFSVFSSKGNLKQCDYALQAALNSSVSVGCSSEDGCVLMAHKKLNKLIRKDLINKVYFVCDTIGVTYSGLSPDFKIQLNIAQKICQEYFDVFEKYPSIETFINEFSLKIQEYTQKSRHRPFGTFLIFAGQSHSKENLLYQVDPSGSYNIKKIISCGQEHENVKSFVERRHSILEDNIISCYNSMKEYIGKLRKEDISIGILREGKFYVYSDMEIEEIIESIDK